MKHPALVLSLAAPLLSDLSPAVLPLPSDLSPAVLPLLFDLSPAVLPLLFDLSLTPQHSDIVPYQTLVLYLAEILDKFQFPVLYLALSHLQIKWSDYTIPSKQ